MPPEHRGSDDRESIEETYVSVDDQLAAYWRPVAVFARRARVPAIILMAVVLSGWIYTQVIHSRRVAWVEHVQRLGLLPSSTNWTDRIRENGSIQGQVRNFMTGSQVTVQVDDPGQLASLLAAPAYPSTGLTLMLPYEPSAAELASIKAKFPKAGLLVFSRATWTGRQVW